MSWQAALVITVGGLIGLAAVIWFAVWVLKWPPAKERWWKRLTLSAPGGAGIVIDRTDSVDGLVAEVISTPNPLPPVFLYATDLTPFLARVNPATVAVEQLLEVFTANTRW